MERKILLATGFEKAFLGIATDFAGHDRAVYDYDKCVEILMKQGMDYAEALEFYDFNIAGAYVGEQTPIFMHKVERKTK